MKSYFFSGILILMGSLVFAQQPVDLGNSPENAPLNLKKLDYSLSTGTSLFSMGGNATGSLFYVAPSFNYQLSSKFKLSGGVMLSRQNFSSPVANMDMKSAYLYYQVPSGANATMFASGDYQVNNRLSLSGTLIKNFSQLGNTMPQGQNNFQLMSMGLQYKITEHLRLGAGVSYYQGNGFPGYYNNPLMYQYHSAGLFQPWNNGF